MFFLIGFTAFVAFSSQTLAQTCYFPNGGVSSLDTACNPNALVSVCCYQGQSCLSNGLCVSDPHNETLARVHRGTCTDKNWRSGNCPRRCLDVGFMESGAPVYNCNQTDSDSYCCYDNCKCTSQFEVMSFGAEEPYTLTIIGESFTQTRTSTPAASATAQTSSVSAQFTGASTTQDAAAAASSKSSSDNKSSNSTAIGVGVGVGVSGALLLLAGAFIFWRWKNRNHAKRYEKGATQNPLEAPANEYYPPTQKYVYYATAKETER
ncbi:hypothetical protein K469DRAFT_717276 [Zopfia rhizophila CBS 207.26]|uniref:Mid2 domain-containing protein n=1 Tax=Zopfia rhizophila CBS 207.26 TaxID=1314779 RepID=A0A6A6ENE7_9PEZI|nr:hypothetical protein K469DRAFT_717276 [Zopfia rhizophila CBS 207.26]